MHCLTQSTSGRVSARSSADQSKMPHEINEVKFPAGTILGIMGSDKQTTIDGMRFKAKYHTVEDEIMIEGTEVIRYIVKELFEEREFHIDATGIVSETPNLEEEIIQ